MGLVNITDSQFDTEVKGANTPVLVDFWAEWCGPCRALGPKLEEIAAEMGETVKIVKVNVDENKEIAQNFSIRSIPTMILFKDGNDVETLMGNLPKEEIVSKIQSHL